MALLIWAMLSWSHLGLLMACRQLSGHQCIGWTKMASWFSSVPWVSHPPIAKFRLVFLDKTNKQEKEQKHTSAYISSACNRFAIVRLDMVKSGFSKGRQCQRVCTPGGMKTWDHWYTQSFCVVLICISLISMVVKYLLICLLAICVFSSEMPLHVFCSFLYQDFVFLFIQKRLLL